MKNLKQSKILVSGHPQFLGNCLVEFLEGFNFVVAGDILNPKAFEGDYDCVFYLPIYEENEDFNLYAQRAIVGTINLCESHPKNVILASSYSVYDLDTPVAHVKLCVEDILSRYAEKQGFKLVILRIGPMLGSYRTQTEPYLYSKAINNFIKQALLQKPLTINTPHRKMRYINVKDVAKTFMNVWGNNMKIKDVAKKISFHKSIKEHIAFLKSK